MEEAQGILSTLTIDPEPVEKRPSQEEAQFLIAGQWRLHIQHTGVMDESKCRGHGHAFQLHC
jgi:hypothetical protein